ncbi:MAG TPA: hypothetical protein VLM75_07530 [Spirochaetota bacterium]|nr:hypothetical protein [Spirochaetota bacterium]
MRILWDNKLAVATLYPSTENVNNPIGNVIVKNTTRTWKTAAKTDQYLTAAGIGADVSALYLLNHNLTATATLKLQGNATDIWTAPSFDENITVVPYVTAYEFTAATYAYWRIVVDDAANTSGFIEIGYMFLGPSTEGPPMKPDHVADYAGKDTAAFSETRQVYGFSGVLFREYTINLPEVSDLERKAILSMYERVRTFRPWMMLIWPDDLVFETPMFCVFKQRPKFTRQAGYEYPWTGQLIITEVY